MSTELVKSYAVMPMQDRMEYAKVLATAGDMIPRGLWMPADGTHPAQPSPAKVLLVLEMGATLGMAPIAALQSIDVIEGTAQVKPRAALALLRNAGHSYEILKTGSIDTGDYAVTVRITRGDDGAIFDGDYSLRDAERAGLCEVVLNADTGLYATRAQSKNGNPLPWQSTPKEMTLWRAAGRAIREGAPEVLMAAPYIEGEVVHAEVEPVVEQSEDWPALVSSETTVDGVKALLDRIKESGELTDAIRTKALAHMGALRAAEGGDTGAAPDTATAE